jgi:hypothetical protein
MIGEKFSNISAVACCAAALLLYTALAEEVLQLSSEGALCENLLSKVTRLHMVSHESLVRANLLF